MSNRSTAPSPVIEAEFAKVAARDFSAVQEVFTRQAFALDEIFNHYAKDAPRGSAALVPGDLTLALRAQSQFRTAVRMLLALTSLTSAAGSPPENKNSYKQTIESGNHQA